MLKDQLEKEIRKRQQYISRSGHHVNLVNDDVLEIRQSLVNGSAVGSAEKKAALARSLEIDPILLEHESRKLEEEARTGTAVLSLARRRSPNRAGSPTRPYVGSAYIRSVSQPRVQVPMRSSMRQ